MTTMNVKEHVDYGRLELAMNGAARYLLRWDGIIYRSAPPKWAAGRDMLTGAGSMKSGARFNAAGSFAMVYGSTTPELAMIESLAFQRRAGLPVEQAMPLVFKAISVHVERLIDLGDARVLAALGVPATSLLAEAWWLARLRGEESLTQAIGRAVHANRIQAISVASAHSAAHGHNILLLPDHISPPSELKVLRHPAGGR
jgi:RES domain-containing protein